ncbi:MAG TPA: trypsin-like peptidase domain-containing protein [Dehalococcoidia bacterium]|nr:trypsin-like peptidase domain-containing protein [Dehalococcoidia bacterium]
MIRLSAIAGLLLAVAIAVAGCSSSSKSPGGGTPTATTTPAGASAPAVATNTALPGTVVVPAIREVPGLTTPEIVAKLAPSIVRVQTESASLDIFGRSVPSTGVGTGVIIDTSGRIVTNNHVVTAGTGNTVATRITVTLNDQRTFRATVVGRDQPTDLAVLKIDATNLTPAQFADPNSLEVGQDVVAIGYALDLQGGPTVTRGVLSAKGRTIDENPYTINDALQTDAGINPGNSGGPLVNANGQVIGINTAIIQGAQQIGFSISVALVQSELPALIQNGQVSRAYLGVGTVEVTSAVAQNFNLPVDKGLAVTAVGQGTPAEAAGLAANDVIVKIDGTDVTNNGQLLAILAKHKAGDVVSIAFYRGNELRTTKVTLAGRPG